jgi:hypothetical protein
MLALAGGHAAAAPTDQTHGTLTAVTVYQGQALVTRDLELAAGAGLREVVITGLPEQIVPGSIYAEPVDGAEIRSVSYRVRPVKQDVRDEVRELDDQIQTTADEIQAHQREQQLLGERTAYLAQLETFTAGTGKQELTHGVLDASTLKELSGFLFDQRKEIAERELELTRLLRDLAKQSELLARQREQLTSGSALNVREAVVFVNLPNDDPLKLRLRYLVGEANWTPSYNLRADREGGEVLVEYNASVQQMSGEDWSDVAMTLSTATLSLVAKAPTLEAMAIRLGPLAPANQPASGVQPGRAMGTKVQLERQLRQLADNRGQNSDQSVSFEGGAEGGAAQTQDFAYYGRFQAPAFGPTGDLFARAISNTDGQLNVLSCELQLAELSSFGRFDRDADKPENTNEQQASVSYELANRTSLPSRSDRQLIQIASIPMPGEFYHLAVPVLTDHVYEEARVINNSDEVLLAGPVSTFVAGQFVGRGEIPTVAVGEGFTVGLGIDSSLRSARELIDRQERIQGGNRVVDFTYQLAIENFDGQPIDVRLLDRIPKAERSDIKLTLVETGEDVSDDAAYRMSDHKEGILRWDLAVPAESVGPDRYVLKYTLQLEYDKQMAITGQGLRR